MTSEWYMWINMRKNLVVWIGLSWMRLVASLTNDDFSEFCARHLVANFRVGHGFSVPGLCSVLYSASLWRWNKRARSANLMGRLLPWKGIYNILECACLWNELTEFRSIEFVHELNYIEFWFPWLNCFSGIWCEQLMEEWLSEWLEWFYVNGMCCMICESQERVSHRCYSAAISGVGQRWVIFIIGCNMLTILI